MRRHIAPDPPEPVAMDDTPTEQLAPPTYVASCSYGAPWGAKAVCMLAPGHDGQHLYEPVEQPRCPTQRFDHASEPYGPNCTLPRGHVGGHEYETAAV